MFATYDEYSQYGSKSMDDQYNQINIEGLRNNSQGSNIATKQSTSNAKNSSYQDKTQIQQTVQYKTNRSKLEPTFEENNYPEIADNFNVILSTGRYSKIKDKKEYRKQLKLKNTL
jgi:hypothetical protein